jgi:hypothetical protein
MPPGRRLFVAWASPDQPTLARWWDRAETAGSKGCRAEGAASRPMAQDEPRVPLTPGQRRAAARLAWYRAWLLSTGRAEVELEPDGEDLAAGEQ